MADDRLLEVHRQLRTSQDKYTYFLLAAAASAVALSLNRTTGSPLSYWQAPLGLAVLCWATSFYFGCRNLAYVNATIYANFELLKVQSGTHPETGAHPQVIAAASKGIQRAIESNSDKANRLAHWQFRFLVTGALLYIGWHVLEMLKVTPCGS